MYCTVSLINSNELYLYRQNIKFWVCLICLLTVLMFLYCTVLNSTDISKSNVIMFDLSMNCADVSILYSTESYWHQSIKCWLCLNCLWTVLMCFCTVCTESYWHQYIKFWVCLICLWTVLICFCTVKYLIVLTSVHTILSMFNVSMNCTDLFLYCTVLNCTYIST